MKVRKVVSMSLQSFSTIYGASGFQDVGASVDDVVLAAAYDTANDGGGGEFVFVAPAATWTIDSFKFMSVSIDGVSGSAGPPASLITITTTTAHGLEGNQRARIEGVDASIDGDWTIVNVTTYTFDLLGSSYTTSFGAGGTASGALLQTAADHGLAQVARIVVGGATSVMPA